MVDKVVIKVKGGKGGDGLAHFYKIRGARKGKIDGGDGGRGGSVYLLAVPTLSTLYDFRSRAIFEAESGGRGEKNNKKGADGEDLIIKVPVGTVVFGKSEGNMREKELLVDLDQPYKKVLIAKGGREGKGNTRFKSSVNRSPTQFTRGEEGEERELLLELKLIADVGLIGLPSAGKTFLLNALTSSKGKVASYNFTTLQPNLGVCYRVGNKGGGGFVEKIIIADIPGLIEGASGGKGLGHDFLRHIERTRVLAHLIDISDRPTLSVLKERYLVIRKELGEWAGELLKKKEIVVLTKSDLYEPPSGREAARALGKDESEVISVSALGNINMDDLKNRLFYLVEKEIGRSARDFDLSEKRKKKVLRIGDLKNKRIVFKNTI